jgi:hypothetical protein
MKLTPFNSDRHGAEPPIRQVASWSSREVMRVAKAHGGAVYRAPMAITHCLASNPTGLIPRAGAAASLRVIFGTSRV